MPDNPLPPIPNAPEAGLPPSSDSVPAIVRTVVPFLVAWLVSKAAEKGLDIDTQQLNNAIILIGGSLYYTVVRLLESKWPKAGYLLGIAKQPVYTKAA